MKIVYATSFVSSSTTVNRTFYHYLISIADLLGECNVKRCDFGPLHDNITDLQILYTTPSLQSRGEGSLVGNEARVRV